MWILSLTISVYIKCINDHVIIITAHVIIIAHLIIIIDHVITAGRTAGNIYITTTYHEGSAIVSPQYHHRQTG